METLRHVSVDHAKNIHNQGNARAAAISIPSSWLIFRNDGNYNYFLNMQMKDIIYH